ncbi:uncharacterized protein LOC127287930 [Leptopilina boulardi]|uniref:uncharacterized protein LOC127278258 n=1 Tax=Leptopilina boulardi TaxID=63433 RepID=UPI0021F50C5B|nr:uncharacterized protein LOC127278258 [Leptopilina boulardi]XP_051155832.1 uncharacterized protein LOC127278259 [Leptopilina boulardi]XP_051171040.1 uncharacterized protein LOC127287930 [Leptopilina boulardi]
MGDSEHRKRRLTALRVRKFRAHKRFCQSHSTKPLSSSTSDESLPQNNEANQIQIESDPDTFNRSNSNVSNHTNTSELDNDANIVSSNDDINVVQANDDNINIVHDRSDFSSSNEIGAQEELSLTSVSEWSASTNDSEISDDVAVRREFEELREWALESNIQQNHLDKLLLILRQRLLPELPKSSKTFLKTSSAKYTITAMSDSHGGTGEFVHFGLKPGLERCINVYLHSNNLIELIIDVDGLPVSKSGIKQMWVNACKIHSTSDVYKPFPVGIYYGNGKPADVDEYMEEFITDLNNILQNGLEVSGRIMNVSLKCFSCDTPARAFLKCTIGHTGRYACERCTVMGSKVNVPSTVYPSVRSAERTDASFRNMEQQDHHHGPSPLTRIAPPIDMIFAFVLDMMHLCFLGVMKKLLEWWLSVGSTARLQFVLRQELSKRMELLKSCVPAEFQRKTRSTKYFLKWKATEFRFFLLYCGPVVLKYILQRRTYQHFLLLHVACRILCCDIFCLKYTSKAKQYLRIFFVALPSFYGKKSQVLNFHHLIHLADDVQKMGCSLSHVMAFPFENLLGKIKRKLRTYNRPLAQLCRRLHEEYMIKTTKPEIPSEIEILESEGENHLKVKCKGKILSPKFPDNVILLNNKKIFKIEKISGFLRSVTLTGRIWKPKQPIFDYPFPSSEINMWELQKTPLESVIQIPINVIIQKFVQLRLQMRQNENERIFVIPLLHV